MIVFLLSSQVLNSNILTENRMEVRQIERKAREQREDAARPEKELFKLPQFRQVESRLYEEGEPVVPKVESFLSKNQSKKRFDEQVMDSRAQREILEAKMEEAKYFSTARAPVSPRSTAIPKSTEVAKLAPRSNTDFINRNRVTAQVMRPPVDDSREDNGRHAAYGRVPDYLENRKATWAEQQVCVAFP
jgi:hypothetical protein